MGVATFAATKDPINLGGTNRLIVGNLTMSASYATNGDTITFTGIAGVGPGEGNMLIGGHGSGGIALEWDGANQKVKAYRQRDPAAAGGADIALPEVTAAVNLSAVVCEAWFLAST